MKTLKQNKGITLIALIITIVIMLILAIVTIAAVNGDGIIGKAKKAKTDYQNAQVEEQGVLDKYLNEMNTILEDNTSGGEEKNPNIATYTEENVPIPVGFKYVEGTKDTGVVVENEADGSQFVWVPVTEEILAYGLGTAELREPDVVAGRSAESQANNTIDTTETGYGTECDNDSTNLNIINNILGTTYTKAVDFLEVLQEDFKLMAASVKKNGGFYVGRYETSLNNGKAQVVKGATSATAETTSANTWYGLYAYQKAYSTESVQGSMIWGSQYDRMMDWMKNTGTDVDLAIGDNRNKDRTTGTKETDKINNVYDLYGNSIEWTLEAISYSSRVNRGGDYNDDIEPSRRNLSNPTNTISYGGSRVSLYIK